jgi:hypothetical protein
MANRENLSQVCHGGNQLKAIDSEINGARIADFYTLVSIRFDNAERGLKKYPIYFRDWN